MGPATRRCPGCGIERPVGETVYDGDFNVSPECWTLFTEVVGAEFQNAVLFGQVHQLTVDAYATQHAGGPHPDKSVDVHLVGLHLVHERGFTPPDVPRHLQRLVGTGPPWPHFDPPTDRGPLTVQDVALSNSPSEHAARARAWARQVWDNWAPHHAAVAALAEGCFVARR